MKIAVVAREFPPNTGGMENHAHNLACDLAKNHDVTVFTGAGNKADTPDGEWDLQKVLRGSIPLDAPLIARKHESLGFDACITMNAGYAPLTQWVKGPVFCYCHGRDFLEPWIRQAGMALELSSRALKVPYLWRSAQKYRQLLTRRSIGIGLAGSEGIFVNSRFTQEQLRQAFPELDVPITVSFPGVPDRFFAQPEGPAPTRDSGPLQLVVIARLLRRAPKKNVDNILRAVAATQQDVPSFLTIIGDGDWRAELEALTGQLGLKERVSFVGDVAYEDIPAYLDKTDLFVLPSKAIGGDVESFGMVYAEAAARGVPSLMSSAGGAVDAVEDGVTGIIINGAEPEHIADGLRQFNERRNEFDRERILEFAEQFRWSVISARLEEQITRGVSWNTQSSKGTRMDAL